MRAETQNRADGERLNFAGHSKKYPNLPLALDGFGIQHLQEPIDRPEGMDFWQWIQCTKGSGRLSLGSQSYIVTPGSGMLLPPGEASFYYGSGESWYINFLCCGGALVKEITSRLGLDTAGVYRLSHPEKILAYWEKISQICEEHAMNAQFALSVLLYQMLVELSQEIQLTNAGKSQPRNEKIHAAVCFMQKHYSENIGLDEIAGAVGLSKEYLCQIFKKHTGSTLLEHLTQTRISEAKVLLLAHPQKTVGEIARLCGFDSPSYFCSVFKKNEHMTPQQFARGII